MRDDNIIDIPDISKTEKKEAMEMDAYLTTMRNRKKQIRINKVKSIKRKAIATGVVVAAGITIVAASSYSLKLSKGTDNICTKYKEATENYGVRDDSVSGLIVNEGDKFISVDDAAKSIIGSVRSNGGTDAEAYIVVSDVLGDDIADKYINISESEIMAVKIHESELAKSKGVSR